MTMDIQFENVLSRLFVFALTLTQDALDMKMTRFAKRSSKEVNFRCNVCACRLKEIALM